MVEDSNPLQHVSDTALWVAYYRMMESQSAQPLFRDDLAKLLVGDKGPQIAAKMQMTGTHAAFNVTIRTYVIDEFLRKLTAQGVDLVLNLGAGMDTRPYRLDLPATTTWIEVDYPAIIELKAQKLAKAKPVLTLERVALDLADRDQRRSLLRSLNARSRNVVVLTEGVLPYLTISQVSELSEDLLSCGSVQFWIADYLSPAVYRYLQTTQRRQQMQNAPFQFFPPEGLDFFRTRGWNIRELSYLPEVGEKLGRTMPLPWFIKLFRPIMPKSVRQRLQRTSGYMILDRNIQR